MVQYLFNFFHDHLIALASMCECVCKMNKQKHAKRDKMTCVSCGSSLCDSTHKPFYPNLPIHFMEYLSVGGLAMLLTNGPVIFFLFRFLEKLNDPEYEEKVFKKTMWK